MLVAIFVVLTIFDVPQYSNALYLSTIFEVSVFGEIDPY
jgi:hypothetical protein